MRIEKKENHANITGSQVHLMLFFSAWQTSLWSEWHTHEGLTKENDTLRVQTLRILSDISNGNGLSVSLKGKEFEKAFNDAEKIIQDLNLGLEYS